MSDFKDHVEAAKAEDKVAEDVVGTVFQMNPSAGPVFGEIVGGREETQFVNSGVVSRDDFDPTKILVQVLQRHTDPLCNKLQRALYGWVAAGVAYMPIEDHFGGWIDVARNWQAQLFRRASRFTHVLMLDADIGPPEDTPYLLRRHDVPVVSGVACGWSASKGGLFICVAVPDASGKSRFVTIKHDNPIPMKGLIEVTNAGTGCLMVRRDVIERLFDKYENDLKDEATALAAIRAVISESAPARLTVEQVSALQSHLRRFSYEQDTWGSPFSIPQSVREQAYKLGRMVRGEDILFTDRVRWDLGLKVYCDLEVHCIHHKTMGLLWPADARKELSPGEWKPSIYSPEVGA